jgi:hypothetical protein
VDRVVDRVAGISSAASAVRAIARVIGAACALGVWGRAYGKEKGLRLVLALVKSARIGIQAELSRRRPIGCGELGEVRGGTPVDLGHRISVVA